MTGEKNGDLILENCDSSNIDKIAYNANTEQLSLTFKNGGQYAYSDVPLHVAQEFIDADSLGQFHACYIKGEYDFTKLG